MPWNSKIKLKVNTKRSIYWILVAKSTNYFNVFYLKIFNGTTKLVPIEQKSTEIFNSISSQIRTVKINVPRGFPTGGTLRSQVSKSVTGLVDIQSISKIIWVEVSCEYD